METGSSSKLEAIIEEPKEVVHRRILRGDYYKVWTNDYNETTTQDIELDNINKEIPNNFKEHV